ncbi:amidohydrolase [Marinilactibacillus kalidii]|uniref:amidohydrolase n=1 Tax=Marinilactibacillus kalidii TaxID=2820274 RepID=UPI001ABE25BF|nr:amidohydrolase [Marinilactibacillus kalidii]
MQLTWSPAYDEKIKAYENIAIEYRRTLHQYPELSFKEYRTSQYIYDEMFKLDHVEVTRPTKTSVLVKITGAKPGLKIGLRADMDALPIQEDRPDLPFASQEAGVMHACGHDGHTALLMTATKILSEMTDELAGEIYSIFQHAEESQPGGAKEMVETGLFNDFDFIYGHHLVSSLETGLIDIKTGPCSGNSDRYDVTIFGKGGHAASPHETIDPVIIGAQIIEKFQTIISRKLDPLSSGVISNTVFQAGDPKAKNIIPDSVLLGGSVRTLDADVRQLIETEMARVIKGTCDSYGVKYDFNYRRGYASVVNNAETTAIIEDLSQTLFPNQIVSLPPFLGGEDFSAFSAIVPSTYLFVGSKNVAQQFDYPHHHPKFGLDEASFPIGIKLFVSIALNYTKLVH